MPKILRRFLLFSGCGMLGLTLWSALFGVVSGAAAYVWAVSISPNRHNSFVSMVSGILISIISIVLPLGFTIFGGAFWLIPEPKKGGSQLLRLCVIRSLSGAVLLALISLSISARSSSNFARSGDGIAPPYFINLVAGWMFGYFIGIFWGLIEGIIRLRKANLPARTHLGAPPIANP